MSYCLLRLGLAEISRECADRSPLCADVSGEDKYSTVMYIDTELRRFESQLPRYYCFQHVEGENPALLCEPQTPAIAVQRYLLNLHIHTQICKAHFPYLARGSLESKFAYSRKACIDSARHIIRMETEMEKEKIPALEIRLRFCTIVYDILIASIVLLVDMCLNVAAGRIESHSFETAEACRILEKARGRSATVEKVHDFLMQLLRKHNVSPLTPGSSVSGEGGGQLGSSSGEEGIQATAMAFDPDAVGAEGIIMSHEPVPDQALCMLDEIWEDLENGVDIGDFNWENTLMGLDASFI